MRPVRELLLLLSRTDRAYRQFDNFAALGEEVHPPRVRGFHHRAVIDRLQQRRPGDFLAGFGVPPNHPVVGVGTWYLVDGHIRADEDATLRRSNEGEELSSALRSCPDRMQTIVAQFQGGDPASETIQGKEPVAQRIDRYSRR